MGPWDLRSDENDWTYGRVGFGIMERMGGLAAAGRSDDGFVKDLIQANPQGAQVVNDPGVAILVLEFG